eukprot:4488847-Prymnesium_polylepis.1
MSGSTARLYGITVHHTHTPEEEEEEYMGPGPGAGGPWGVDNSCSNTGGPSRYEEDSSSSET